MSKIYNGNNSFESNYNLKNCYLGLGEKIGPKKKIFLQKTRSRQALNYKLNKTLYGLYKIFKAISGKKKVFLKIKKWKNRA